MAMTREYLELVESGIDIAPVGSQEEVQAADYMLEAFKEHGLETELQDLTAPLYGRVISGVALILMMVCAVFCGLGGFGWAIGGFLGALVVGAFLMSDYLGMNPIGDAGPRAESQNVIGIHRGEGPRAGRGVRPIVVLCRYDTGREELFANPAIAPYVPFIKGAAPWCIVIVVIGAILQLFQFMAGPALIVLWIITMAVGLPLAVFGVNEVTAPFMNLTDGANDNKASLASLLGVLEDVVPNDEERIRVRAAQLAEAVRATSHAEADDDRVYEEYEAFEDVPVVGVRHGRRVIEAIGMLPPTCEIEYEKPGRRRVVKRRVVETPPEKAAVTQAATGSVPAPVEVAASDGAPRLVVVSDREGTGAIAAEAEDADGETAPIERIVEEVSEELGLQSDALRSQATETQRRQIDAAGVEGWGVSEFGHGGDRSRRSLLFDLPDPSEEERDPLLAEAESEGEPSDQPTELVSVEEVEARADEVAVEAEEGHGGRRHRGKRDKGDKGDKGDRGKSKHSLLKHLPFGRKKKKEESLSEWLDVAEDFDARTEGEEIGTWDNFNGEEDDWRGGATRSSDARDRLARIRAMADEVEGEIESHGAEDGDARRPETGVRASELADGVLDGSREPRGGRGGRRRDAARGEGVLELVDDGNPSEPTRDEVAEEAAIASLSEDLVENAMEEPSVPDVAVITAPTDDELADSVLEMGDVNLVAHDIWFVCVGASALGHAGTKAFVEAHRRELRGCFVVNLDSIGAGDLTALTSEGFGDSRRGDRKIQKLLGTASKVVHVPIMLEAHDWEDTDATPALRRSMRGLTLMGTVGGKQRALANTSEDISENLNPNQVVYVSQLVSEIIRRA